MTTSGFGMVSMLRIQSAVGPKALITTASGPSFRYSKTSRTVWRRRPVRRPTWISSKKRRPSSQPHFQRYKYSGARKRRRSAPVGRRDPYNRFGMRLRELTSSMAARLGYLVTDYPSPRSGRASPRTDNQKPRQKDPRPSK